RARNDLIAVDRVELDQARLPVGPFAGDKSCAAAAKAVEDEITAAGAVPDGVGYERERLDRWVHGKLIEPICAEHIRPGIGPDIAAVTAMLSELDIVNVLAAAVLPDKDQFVLAAVERAHAAIGFSPNDKVLELPVDAPAGGQHLIHMAPIRAHEVDCAVRGVFGEQAKASSRNFANCADFFSPLACTNSRCLMRPLPETWPRIGTL